MPDYPLVTVVIPSFNHGKYIQSSIQSVLKQSYQPLELIVIDDGSSDDSVSLITAMQEQHKFTFIHRENRGLNATLNQALSLAKGEFFLPLASDDVMTDNRIEIQVKHMQAKADVAICSGNVRYIYDNQLPVSKVKPTVSQAEPAVLVFDDFFPRKSYAAVFAPTCLYRTSVIKEVGGFDESIAVEDVLMQLKVTNIGYKIKVVSDVLAEYRIHTNNMHKNYQFMTVNMVKIYDKFSHHPLYEQVKFTYLNAMFVKCSKKDKPYALQIIKQLPLRFWNTKTLKGFFNLLLGRK